MNKYIFRFDQNLVETSKGSIRECVCEKAMHIGRSSKILFCVSASWRLDNYFIQRYWAVQTDLNVKMWWELSLHQRPRTFALLWKQLSSHRAWTSITIWDSTIACWLTNQLALIEARECYVCSVDLINSSKNVEWRIFEDAVRHIVSHQTVFVDACCLDSMEVLSLSIIPLQFRVWTNIPITESVVFTLWLLKMNCRLYIRINQLVRLYITTSLYKWFTSVEYLCPGSQSTLVSCALD